jgi:hypothetical protein
MPTLLCPGYHAPALTDEFINGLASAGLPLSAWDYRVFPAHREPPYSPWHVENFLRSQFPKPPARLVFIGFSAGVVGAIATARQWHRSGHPVTALMAMDGWGMPLGGDFPIHRISHDYLTHWTSSLLGTGVSNFYADPPVTHLALWRVPQQVRGHVTDTDQLQTTLAHFLVELLTGYGELNNQG